MPDLSIPSTVCQKVIDFPGLVAAAKIEFRDYISEHLIRYEVCREERRKRRLPVIAFCGYGRSGKDEAAAYVGCNTSLIYGGSISHFVLPMIASSLGLSPEEAWFRRHDDPFCGRTFWREWCDVFRKEDPSILMRIVLGATDIISGVRGKPELFAAWEEDVIDHVVWVDRPGTPVDPTVEYTRAEVLNDLEGDVLLNDLTLDLFHSRVRELLRSLRVPMLCD